MKISGEKLLNNKNENIFPLLYIVYVNDQQYLKNLSAKKHFYLLLELSESNRKNLLKIVKDCKKHDYFLGIIFMINKNELLLDRLFFLKSITIELMDLNKRVGIWGIPYCAKKTLFGAYDFSQFAYNLIPEKSSYYSVNNLFYQTKSTLLTSCYQCIESIKCLGLGIQKENNILQDRGSISHDYRIRGRDMLFRTKNIKMQNLYNTFTKYVDSSDLTYANRYLYFVNNVDFGSIYSFTNRFVYHCDFLPPHEYEEEFLFLSKVVQNIYFLNSVKTLISKGMLSRIAYSRAEKENIIRESFYVSPKDEYDYELLKYFNLKLDNKLPYKLYGIGIDFYNNELKSYKVYFIVPSNDLSKLSSNDLEKIDINIETLKQKEHYYVLRFNKDKKIISKRVDLMYSKEDKQVYMKLLEKFSSTQQLLEIAHIFALSFEFQEEKIEKMNLYYQNIFSG